MPCILETKGGGRLIPLSVLDVMEAVEDYMGTDVRQYLEEYLLKAESEAGEVAGEEIYDHYEQVLINIKDETEAAVRPMGRSRMDRKAIRVTLDIILKMIEEEY